MSRRHKILLMVSIPILAAVGIAWLFWTPNTFIGATSQIKLGMTKADAAALLAPYAQHEAWNKVSNTTGSVRISASSYHLCRSECSAIHDYSETWFCPTGLCHLFFDNHDRIVVINVYSGPGSWETVRNWLKTHLGI